MIKLIDARRFADIKMRVVMTIKFRISFMKNKRFPTKINNLSELCSVSSSDDDGEKITIPTVPQQARMTPVIRRELNCSHPIKMLIAAIMIG